MSVKYQTSKHGTRTENFEENVLLYNHPIPSDLTLAILTVAIYSIPIHPLNFQPEGRRAAMDITIFLT